MKAVKIFVACVFGILAISGAAADGALAVEADWALGNESFTELGVTEKTTSLGTSKSIAFTVPSKSTTITCFTVEGSGKISKGGSEEFTAKLSKCEAPKCTVEPITLEAKTLVLAAGTGLYAKIEAAKEGKLLTTIKTSGKECPLSPTMEVKGSAAAEVSMYSLEKQPLTFSESITSTVNNALAAEGKSKLKLTFGESQEITLTGDVYRVVGPSVGFARPVKTALCDELPAGGAACAAGHLLAANLNFKMAQEVSMEFLDPFMGFAVVCTASTIEGKTGASSVGTPVHATVKKIEFTGCKNGATACSNIVGGGTPYAALISAARFDGTGFLGFGSVALTITCGAKSCSYKGLVGTLVFSGAPAKLSGTALGFPPFPGEPAGCVGLAWSGVGAPPFIKYKFTEPATAFYVTAG